MVKQRLTFISLCRAIGQEHHVHKAAAGARLSAGYSVLVNHLSSFFQHNSHGMEIKDVPLLMESSVETLLALLYCNLPEVQKTLLGHKNII